MPRWLYKCSQCGYEKDAIFRSLDEANEKSVWCDNPAGCTPTVPGGVCRMIRQASAPSFSIKGYSAANGYAKPS